MSERWLSTDAGQSDRQIGLAVKAGTLDDLVKMEAGVAVVIALVTGLSAVTTRLHKRIDELDTRVDKHELRVAESYISKTDFACCS